MKKNQNGLTLVESLIVVSLVGLVVSLAFLAAFNKQARVRGMGGEMVVELPHDHKIVHVTWKEQQLWYLVRPMRPGEYPETNQFKEKSASGVMKGEVVFKESVKALAEAPR